MRCAWIVTEDNVTGDDLGLPSRVGWSGPAGATGAEIELARTAGREWRTRCDEPLAEVPPCYYGRIWTQDGPGSEDDFGPLDDLGTPDAGCVTIEYKNEDGEWAGL